MRIVDSFLEGDIKIAYGNCLELMPKIASGVIDMVLADLPYGTTACSWDVIIPFDKLWQNYNRIIKPNSAMVFTAREPFTSLLVVSNIKNYRHKWVWNKKQSGSFQNAKYMPLQIDEDILVFCPNRVNYNPIMRTGKMRKRGGATYTSRVTQGLTQGYAVYSDQYFPVNIIEIANPRLDKLHPTQKPVELMEYLIKTYTNEGDLVLDNTMGSGTTGVACVNTGRRFLGIELELQYYEIARDRITQAIIDNYGSL